MNDIFYIRFVDGCCWHGSTQFVFFLGKLFQNMLGICHRDSGGGGGEFCAADEPLVDALIGAFDAIVLCSIFWLEADVFDCDGCDWEDTPAAAAAAAATANADKSFLFFLLRFRADDAVPMGSTHITCVWFFCVLLNLRAEVLL